MPRDLTDKSLCEVCKRSHCYWCGLDFGTSLLSKKSREHLREFMGAPAEKVVYAHVLCNSVRGHDKWTPYHSRKHGMKQRRMKMCAVRIRKELANGLGKDSTKGH